MKIAIDVRPVKAQRAGIGIYSQNLVSALSKIRDDEEYILLGDPDTSWSALPSGPGFKTVTIEGHASLWHLRAAKLGRGVDVYHSPSSLFVPLLLRERAVVTVHDLVPFVMPEVSNTKTWWTHRVFGLAVRQAGAIIAVSQHTASDLRMVVPGLTTPVWSIHEAPRTDFFPRSNAGKTCTPYLLAVGTLEPRKNLATLLRAYRLAGRKDDSLPKLVVVGKLGWKNTEFEKCLADEWMKERVELTGYVSDKRLRELFQEAQAFIYPSRYEGFGLPVLEAMACGTPVITSTCSSLPEIGGNAAIYVDPHDEQELSEAILRVQDPKIRRDLAAQGIARASEFSWETTARETRAVYQTVSASRRA